MTDQEKTALAAGAGAFGYLLFLGFLFTKTLQEPEYWVRVGWRQGRRNKKVKLLRELPRCVPAMQYKHGPEAFDLCGSLMIMGQNAGVDGKGWSETAALLKKKTPKRKKRGRGSR